jgi:predicted AAA+ superfamily ATPase
MRGRTYRTLDDFATLAAARANPESLLGEPVILDEAQRSPDLLLAVKKHADESRRPGRVLLSGSANLALLGQVSETLAGRAGYYALHPMTRREIRRGTATRPFLTDFIRTLALRGGQADPVTDQEVLAGGLPPACLGPADGSAEWFRAYVQTYVERDVLQLSRITDLVAFQTLARMAALRTAQVLATIEPGRDDRLRGALFETWVCQNLVALLDAHLPDAQLSYWHEQGRYEVDFVIETGRRVVAVEVKAASRWTERDLAGLRAFLDRTPQCAAAVLAYNGRVGASLGGRLWAVPIGSLVE